MFRLLWTWSTFCIIVFQSSPAFGKPQAVVFGGDTDYPPYEWLEDDKAVGFLIEIEKEVARAGSSRAIHILRPWPETVAGLRSGAVDVVPMFRSKEREKTFWFSRPLFFAHHAIFTAEDPGRVTELEQLVRWKVAVEHSSFAHDQLASTPIGSRLVLVGNTQDALIAVTDGRADYAVLSEVPSSRLAKKLRLAITRVGAPLWPRDYAFAVKKDRSALIAWLENSLQKTISNGGFQRIQAKWQPLLDQRNITNDEGSSFLIVVVSSMAIILVVILGGQYLIGRERRKSIRPSSHPLGEAEDSQLLQDFQSFGREEIFSLYQPQLDLHSGEIRSAEALVRWNHRSLGLLTPDQFVPQLEQGELIGQLTARMIELAIEQSAAFSEVGRQLRCSVNISAKDFVGIDLPRIVLAGLAKHGGRAEDLVLELTETSVVIDPDSVKKIIGDLQSIGVRIALDDYGKGSASLASFTEFSFDELKIDRFFIERMACSSSHQAAVSSAIKMAHGLGMEVVAEGAPDLTTIQLLRKLRCDKVQSFAISPPLSAQQLLSFVSEFTQPWKGRSRTPPLKLVKR